MTHIKLKIYTYLLNRYKEKLLIFQVWTWTSYLLDIRMFWVFHIFLWYQVTFITHNYDIFVRNCWLWKTTDMMEDSIYLEKMSNVFCKSFLSINFLVADFRVLRLVEKETSRLTGEKKYYLCKEVDFYPYYRDPLFESLNVHTCWFNLTVNSHKSHLMF